MASADAPKPPELQPKMFVVPALMLTVKFLKLDFSVYVDELRLGFACACALTLGVHLLVKSIAAGKADGTEITVTTTNPMKPGEKETKTWTVCNYDQARPPTSVHRRTPRARVRSVVFFLGRRPRAEVPPPPPPPPPPPGRGAQEGQERPPLRLHGQRDPLQMGFADAAPDAASPRGGATTLRGRDALECAPRDTDRPSEDAPRDDRSSRRTHVERETTRPQPEARKRTRPILPSCRPGASCSP